VDIETHLRFLVALPLLILAELVVHQRLRPVLRQFLERDLILDSSRPRFDEALPAALRLRNSAVAEILQVVLVYGVGVLYLWPRFTALSVPTWYADPAGDGRRLSPAGWWFVFVSLPLFQFILLRWYFRLFIWGRFLWHVTRCELSLVPTHPDRAGGLGFLSTTPIAFAPLLAAHGVILAGMIASQIFFHGARLPEFKVEVIVVVVFLLLVVLAPLLLFVPHLSPMDRGMLCSIYAEPTREVKAEELIEVYKKAYANAPFVRVRTDTLPATKDVATTNFCDVTARVAKGKVILFSALDNLLKGASGQAVQNMNIMFGIDQTSGLY
jgi:hypothetical protein